VPTPLSSTATFTPLPWLTFHAAGTPICPSIDISYGRIPPTDAGGASAAREQVHSEAPQRTVTGFARGAATAATRVPAGSKTASRRSPEAAAGRPSAYPATARTT
jgi:hypothetical protein